ncbi:MAG: hypothetical protein FP832_01810 [Nitrospirae bacterium]|nr:hypothetical protein [Nitrospirota bacterium]
MICNKFFGFREEPFGLTPNPKFLYMSKNHEEAIAHLELLKLINNDFGVTAADSTEKDNLEALNNFLLDVFSKNEKAVLIIEEAQAY